MEILWWLVPSGVVMVIAMLWVSWLGRDGRGEVDRDVLVARMEKALRTEHQGLRQASPRVTRRRDRSTGVAVRSSPAGDRRDAGDATGGSERRSA